MPDPYSAILLVVQVVVDAFECAARIRQNLSQTNGRPRLILLLSMWAVDDAGAAGSSCYEAVAVDGQLAQIARFHLLHDHSSPNFPYTNPSACSVLI